MSDTEQLLHVLLNKGITPNFSFPLDTCQFVAEGLESWRPHKFASMTQDLKNALREYSPGKKISVDGKEYTVGGLSFFNPSNRENHAIEYLGEDTSHVHLKWYSRCSENRCGWVYGRTDVAYNTEYGDDGELLRRECPLCGSNHLNGGGVVSSQWFRPQGFAPIIVPYDKDGQEIRNAPQGRTKNMKPKSFSRTQEGRTAVGGRVELPAPLMPDDNDAEDDNEDNLRLLEVEDSPLDENVQYLVSRELEEGNITKPGIQLVLMNTGYNGRGFWVCASCGKTEVLRENDFGIGGLGHHRPYSPIFQEGADAGRCHGPRIYGMNNLGKLMFGMTFRTDMAMLRVNFSDEFCEPRELSRLRELDLGIRALKEALITEINDVYEFESREISSGFRKWIRNDTTADGLETQSLVLDIFFYDDVSGGAGLSSMLFRDQERWQRVIHQTEIRLRGGHCINQDRGCDSACIGCLLDFRNTQDHDNMNRKHGLRLLRWLIDKDSLPSLESGDANPDSLDSITSLSSLFNLPEGHIIDTTDNSLVFKDQDDNILFNIRPVSSLLNHESQPYYESDEENYEEVSSDLDLGEEYSDEESDVIFYFPYGEISDKVVRIEQRIFPGEITI